MKSHSRQSLWNLLGHASHRKAPDGFPDRVSARARTLRQHHAHPFLQISAAAAAVLVLVLGAALFFHPAPPGLHLTSQGPEEALLLAGEVPVEDAWAEEFEGIVFMDELLAVHDPAVLDDEALARLLFR